MSTGTKARLTPAFYDDAPARAERGGSLFLRIARFCGEQTLTMQDMRQLLRSTWLKRSCFEIPFRAGTRLRRALAVGTDDWDIIQPRSLVDKFQAAAFVANQLRYCPRCLATGWHSALFQYLALRSCPQHRVPLATGCPRCGATINPAPATLVEHHLYCPDCGASFVGGAIGPLQTHVERFAAVRTALRRPTRAAVVLWPTDHCADRSLRSAADCNAAAIHSVLSTDRVQGLRVFPHVTMPLPGGESESPVPVLRRYAFEHTANFVKWLMGLIVLECGCQALDTCARLVRRFNATTCDEVSIVGVAFWQTALALNMPRSFGEAPAEFYPLWVHPAPSWLPDRAEALQHAIQAHGLALYSVNLLNARKYRSIREIQWTAGFSPNAPHVTPAWWIEGRGNKASWVLRSRIDREGVLRLLRRYRNQMLR